MRTLFKPNLALGMIIGMALTWATMQGLVSSSIASGEAEAVADNEELARLFKEDQDVRSDEKWNSTDPKEIQAADEARRSRVDELYRDGRLVTGKDYYHAAMIFQHGATPDDFLLAHEFSVAAIILGDPRGKWLAAASEDRLLMNLDRPQRFATQYRSHGKSPLRLYQVDTAVTDSLRLVFDVRKLADAVRLAEEMAKQFKVEKP